MAKSNEKITFKGAPIPVSGREVHEGDSAPDFRLTGMDLNDVDLNSFKGKTVVIAAVPSLDTGVCDTEIKRFNTEMEKLSKDVLVLTVSRDLPFAQKRWCGTEGVNNVTVASDYKYRVFGKAFGCELETLGLLTRAVFVVDKQGKVRYVEYVSEVTQEPDYNAVLNKVRELAA